MTSAQRPLSTESGPPYPSWVKTWLRWAGLTGLDAIGSSGRFRPNRNDRFGSIRSVPADQLGPIRLTRFGLGLASLMG